MTATPQLATATATRSAPALDPALLSAPAAPRTRLLALDVFRGITVAGMLLVNDPGSWGAIYPPLEHAAWNGWTPTDLIFPFFLFIAGVTTYLSL
jgi:predicted acyltransferase